MVDAENLARNTHSARKKVFLHTFLQTMAPASLLVVVLVFAFFGFLVPLLEESHLFEKRLFCKNLLQVQFAYLETLHRETLNGILSVETAQSRALNRMRSLRFGNDNKDYFWILGPDRTFLMHPYRPDLEGVNPDKASKQDRILLRHLFTLVEATVSSPSHSGIMNYEWYCKDNPTSLTSKTSFAALFEPWNWVVGTGVYLDDVERDIAEWKRRLVGVALFSIAAAGGVSFFLSLRAAQASHLDRSLKEKTMRLEWSETQLALITQVYEHAAEGVAITDSNGKILEVNHAFTTMTGYMAEEITGLSPDILKSNKHDPRCYEKMRAALKENNQWTGEIWARRKNNEDFPVWLNIVGFKSVDVKTTHYIGVFQDLSELHHSREKLLHETFHDGLTGLPNRFFFHNRLAMDISKALEKQNSIFVVMIGLDRFGSVNKTIGYPTGDILLKETGRRLSDAAGNPWAVARFGGDEFVVLLSDENSFHAHLRTVERMLHSIRQPFILEGEIFRLTASAGITIYPRDGESPEDLLQNAALAMERAKREGGNTWRLFTEELDRNAQKRLRLEAELGKGFAAGEFHLYYQPKISLKERKIIGVEALLRWTTANGETISPEVFIPLAEEIGEIHVLGNFALEQACIQVESWRKAGQDLLLAVNISAQQILHPRFVQDILEIIERTGMDTHRIELEITESTFMKNPEHATRIMNELSERGIRFALDDFGTGFSSLSHIRRLPLSGIKIDRSFISDLDNEKTHAVVSTMIHLAQELKFEFTVEGVETLPQFEAILQLISGENDAFIQGFLFSRPLSPEKIPPLLSFSFPDIFGNR